MSSMTAQFGPGRDRLVDIYGPEIEEVFWEGDAQ